MKKSVKITLTVILSLILATAFFLAGYYVSKFTKSDAASSFEWFIKTVEDNYYFGGNVDEYAGEGLSAIADKYLDRYSEYFTKEEYAETLKSNSGSKSGIGISYSYVSGKGIFIASVVGNSPAYMQGLRAGEWIESGKCGEREVTFSSSVEFQSFIDGAKFGEEINLFATDGSEYVVSKSEYTASYTYLATNSTAWVFKSTADGGLALFEQPSEKIEELPHGAAYIRLSQFYGTAASEFYKLAEKFNAYGCTSLILDLRSNGGGYVSVMQDIAGSFAGGERKPAMFAVDKKGNSEKYDCAKISEVNYRIPSSARVYVLANSGTASASEALIGALICYGALDYEDIFLSKYSDEYMNWVTSSGGENKNAQTYGKGIMQSTFLNFATGEALKLTTAKIFWPDGKTCIHDKGLKASDGCRLSNASWQHTKGDEELKEVLAAIKGE